MDTKLVNRKLFDEVMVPNYNPQDIIPVTGKGSKLWDQQGNEFIDFAGGIAVNALGHCHPHMTKAIQQQSEKLWHLSNVYTNEPALTLAQQLIQNTFAEKVFFCNSGSEANEAAFKLARKYSFDNFGPQKHEIISFNKSFHGRTLFTVTVGGQEKYREGFKPTPAGVNYATYNDLESVKKLISNNTCAVVVEPIQGEGGVIPAAEGFLEGLRKLCDKHQALLVFDEVQSGVYRTGKMYAYMHTSIAPDILTSAKALGGGFPIGAMLTSSKIAKSFGFGTHGSTYGGNPLACAVSNSVLDTLNNKEIINNIANKHNLFINKLKEINKKYNIFNDIRGQGLLIGCELIEKYQGKAKSFVNAAKDQGVLLLVAGPNVLRFTPSLIIPDEDIIKGLTKLEQAITSIVGA
jgi:acetylornithine/N-succinyldiaminopimelate aminotransferase